MADRDEMTREELIRAIGECLEGDMEPSLPEDDLFFVTASAAEDAISMRRHDARYLRSVAEYVADPNNEVLDSGTNFHNLAMEFRRVDDMKSALMVARRGIDLHPADTDLIGVALLSATSCGDYATCDDLIAHAEGLDRRVWSEKLYKSIIDYYLERLGDPMLPDAEDRVSGCLKDFERRYPFSDQAYKCHAQMLILLGRVDEAAQLLHRVIFGSAGPDANSREAICAPACCLIYIDDILSDKGGRAAYEEISRVARKGVQFTAEEQPSATIGYFLYRDAEAMDALICSDEDQNAFKNEARVRDILRTYQCAYGLLAQHETYRATIRERYLILTIRSGITDMPLKGERA